MGTFWSAAFSAKSEKQTSPNHKTRLISSERQNTTDISRRMYFPLCGKGLEHRVSLRVLELAPEIVSLNTSVLFMASTRRCLKNKSKYTGLSISTTTNRRFQSKPSLLQLFKQYFSFYDKPRKLDLTTTYVYIEAYLSWDEQNLRFSISYYACILWMKKKQCFR